MQERLRLLSGPDVRRRASPVSAAPTFSALFTLRELPTLTDCWRWPQLQGCKKFKWILPTLFVKVQPSRTNQGGAHCSSATISDWDCERCFCFPIVKQFVVNFTNRVKISLQVCVRSNFQTRQLQLHEFGSITTITTFEMNDWLSITFPAVPHNLGSNRHRSRADFYQWGWN